MLGALIGAGASLVGGAMSRNSARKDASRARKNATEDVLLQLPRLKQSAIDAGFNPLTALTATGGQGFNPSTYGGPPPLASTEMIVEGLKGVGDIVTGKAAQERAARQLDLDLAKLQMEVLKANALAIRTGVSAAQVGGGSARMGRQAIAWPSGARVPVAPHPLAPGRKIDRQDVTDSPGLMDIDNGMTGGRVTVPGDSEPWGIDELAAAAIVGVPQLGWNWGLRAGQSLKPKLPEIAADLRSKAEKAAGPSKKKLDLRRWPLDGFGFDNYRK